MAIGTTIKTIQDIMRKDAGVDGDAQRISQLVWMIFLKVFDDREAEKELLEDGYRSPVPAQLRWRAWAKDAEGITGEALLDFVNGDLFKTLKELPASGRNAKIAGVVRGVFEDAYNYMKSGTLMRQVVNKLEEIDFNRASDRHEFGDIYEKILGDLQSAGNAGEYYTPRAVTQFAVDQVDPKLGEAVLDPACGTGGFLTCAIEHVRRKYVKSPDDEAVLQGSIRGVEKKPLPHLLCVTNMMFHGIDVPSNVVHDNTLARPLRDYGPRDRVDVVVTNPPFGGMEEDGIEQNFPQAFRTRETADLFLVLIMTLLKPGGRGAIVLPDGFLFGTGVKTRIKERLLEECNLHTIVRLPKGAFNPYTALKTNILFFTKGEPTKTVWYYEHPYPAGYKSYSKTRPLRIEEFDVEKKWWEERKEGEHAWRVSIDEIKTRDYDLDIRKPIAGAGQAPSRLLSLKLRGFRGFRALNLELPDEGPAVLIGANGAGKSTVLDAIAMHLSSFAALASGLSARHAEVRLTDADIRVGDESAEVDATFRVGRDEQFWALRTSRARGAASSDENITRQAEALQEWLRRSGDANLALYCFYPATRGIGDGGIVGRRSTSRPRQLEAYDHAFAHGLGPFQDFLRWFREEEDVENEGRLRIDPGYRSPQLDVVRRALQCFLDTLGGGRFSNLRVERVSTDDTSKGASKGAQRPAELVLEKDGVRLRIGQLSEGEKNTILLVSDLARRLATANPSLDDPLKGEGVVLIDEIDLHLHPSWHRGILPALSATFPRCQLIVSTHSPQVLSHIAKEHVFIFENFELVRVTPHTYGRDTNSILGEVMGLPERPTEIEQKIRRASILVDEERLDEAKIALDELVSILGEHDTAIVRLRTLATLLES